MKPIKCFKAVREIDDEFGNKKLVSAVVHPYPEFAIEYKVGEFVRPRPELLQLGYGIIAASHFIDDWQEGKRVVNLVQTFGASLSGLKIYKAIGFQTKLLALQAEQSLYNGDLIWNYPSIDEFKNKLSKSWNVSLKSAFRYSAIPLSSIKLIEEIQVKDSETLIDSIKW